MELASNLGIKLPYKTSRKLLKSIYVLLLIWLIGIPVLVRIFPELFHLRILSMTLLVVWTFIFLFISAIVPRSALVADAVFKPRTDKVSVYMTESVMFMSLLVCIYCFYLIIVNFYSETKFFYNFYAGNVNTIVLETKVTETGNDGYVRPLMTQYRIENYPEQLSFYFPVPMVLREGETHKFLIIPERNEIIAVDEQIPAKYFEVKE